MRFVIIAAVFAVSLTVNAGIGMPDGGGCFLMCRIVEAQEQSAPAGNAFYSHVFTV